jgi:hypothetical protein
MRRLLMASALMVVLPSVALAGDRQSFNPWGSMLQGQALEEGQARAQQYEDREYYPFFYRPQPQPRQRPTVRNPYSPYLGLPSDMAEGMMLDQLNQMQNQLDRLERRNRR